MEILRTGQFSLSINADDLSNGLRQSDKNPRDKKSLIECIGAVGIDNVLTTIEDLESIRTITDEITDGFPYPQIFVFPNLTIVCGRTDIYELSNNTMVHKLGPVTSGGPWTVSDFGEFVYMSNGQVSVTRSILNQSFSLSNQPLASAIFNYGGQVIIGSPDEFRTN